MRLTENQKLAILNLSSQIFSPRAKVYLFGSRVDDSTRGGDIDLMILWDTSHEEPTPLEIYNLKIHFLVKLKQLLGDQKIDLIIQTSDKPEKPITQIAKNQGVLLNP
jgi:predicted nucleotidyltransferase